MLLTVSDTGVGSTFRIYFPRVEGEATVLASLAEPAVLPTGTETILLVEDDSSVRQMAALVLRKSGYAVIEAANGQEAFQLARKQDQSKISLLLSDIVMPLTGGVEFVQQLKLVLPELRVLYKSGHTDQALTSRGGLRPETHILQKPFTPEMLTRGVREALDERKRKS